MSDKRPELEIKSYGTTKLQHIELVFNGRPRFSFNDMVKAEAFKDGYLACWDDGHRPK